MPTRSARRDDDAVELEHLLPCQIQPTQLREAFVDYESAAHRVLNSLRLLEDLLEHEVIEAALLDLIEIPVDSTYALPHALRIQIQDFVAVAGEHAHLAVVEIDYLTRVLQNGRDVARDVELVLAKTKQQRTSFPRGDDLVGIPAREHGDAVGTLHEVKRIDHRVLERVVIHGRFNQVSQHFRVRFGAKMVSL